VELEAWAIPELLDVKLEPAPAAPAPAAAGQAAGMRFSWKLSPLEQEAELFGGYDIVLRDRAGVETVAGQVPAGVAEFLVQPPPGLDLEAVCVRARDQENHLGPLACTTQGGEWSLAQALFEDTCVNGCGRNFRFDWKVTAEPGTVVGSNVVHLAFGGGTGGRIDVDMGESTVESYSFSWGQPPQQLVAGESISLRLGIRLTLANLAADCSRIRALGWEGKPGKPMSADMRVEVVGAAGAAVECRNCTLHSDHCSPDVSAVATVVVPQGAPPDLELDVTLAYQGEMPTPGIPGEDATRRYRFVYRAGAPVSR
jgi:hypothetical protein